MITVVVNGKQIPFDQPISIHAFIVGRGLDPAAVVVEYNREIMAAEAFAKTMLKDNDRLELLNFVGGG